MIKKMEDKIRNRFKEFLETYPEDMRTRIKPSNCIALMKWAYKEGVKDGK